MRAPEGKIAEQIKILKKKFTTKLNMDYNNRIIIIQVGIFVKIACYIGI